MFGIVQLLLWMGEHQGSGLFVSCLGPADVPGGPGFQEEGLLVTAGHDLEVTYAFQNTKGQT